MNRPETEVFTMITQPEHDNIPDSKAQLVKDLILYELGHYVFNQLCSAFGRETIELPKRPEAIREDHFLAQAIGLENARIMTKVVGNAHYYVPLPSRGTNPEADPAELVRAGYANWEIAKVIGFTERHVRRILNRHGITNPNRKSRSLPALLGKVSGGGAPVQSGGFA
ncbi:hypothetical protein D2T29_14990 [Sinirhodobacter populi]|uniref:Uncharacterized protein n=1 Tax=Paenirhodobacter populi TaxID=2306993 RepID=A0A443K8S6_9RHOB|nr:hypothetical protein [Sinirhodobacter populi]RWR29191.1 hypothetical protein D2T29_14990 [Sinirhodobacter populi]